MPAELRNSILLARPKELPLSGSLQQKQIRTRLQPLHSGHTAVFIFTRPSVPALSSAYLACPKQIQSRNLSAPAPSPRVAWLPSSCRPPDTSTDLLIDVGGIDTNAATYSCEHLQQRSSRVLATHPRLARIDGVLLLVEMQVMPLAQCGQVQFVHILWVVIEMRNG